MPDNQIRYNVHIKSIGHRLISYAISHAAPQVEIIETYTRGNETIRSRRTVVEAGYNGGELGLTAPPGFRPLTLEEAPCDGDSR